MTPLWNFCSLAAPPFSGLIYLGLAIGASSLWRDLAANSAAQHFELLFRASAPEFGQLCND